MVTNAVSYPLHARLFDFKFAIHINLKQCLCCVPLKWRKEEAGILRPKQVGLWDVSVYWF